MVGFRKLIKWLYASILLAFLQEKTANIFGAAMCSPPCLLFTNTTNIIALDYRTSAAHSVVSGLTRAIAIDVHFSLGYIFWSDVHEQNIKRSAIDGTSVTTIITNVGVCDGLAVEWRTSQLYWTDLTSDTISVSDLSGNNQRSLLSSGLDQPRDIALDPDHGLMIWTDWGTSPKIEKATLSGNQRVAIVTSNLQWPNGIELDRGNKRIYWVDGAKDRIESIDYNGSNRVLLSRVTGFHPFGVAMIPPFLFVTDWALRTLLHQLDAQTGYFLRNNFIGSGRPMGIVAYDSSKQSPVSNQCAVNNGGCSHFCVVTSSGHVCMCPTGFALKQDARTCEDRINSFLLFTDADDKSTNMISLDVNYFIAKKFFNHLGNQRPIALDFDHVEDRVFWTDVEQGLIISAFSNATSLKILFRCNVNVPDGLAIDKVGRNIYWSDTGTNRIEVARLDGTKRKVLIKDGLDEPRAIVLDERNGTMYWTDWGSNPKIEKADMDGASRRSIVTGNLGWPNGLTIDQTTNLLYWADAKLDKIEVSDLSGCNRRLILSSAADVHPFGLTVYQGMLYWTDWNNKSITRLDLSNGNREMIITGLKKPMDIHLYDSSAAISGSHPCATNNGLCSDLCLLKPDGEYQCACPTGIALKPDGKTCDYDEFYRKSSDQYMLFAEANTAEIYKVSLAVPGTPCEPLEIRNNISRPVAIDYDPVEGRVYWSDVTLKKISRAYPNGSGLEVIAKDNVETPDGLAVDWIGRNLYWTDAGTNKTEVSRLDGSFRTSLVTANVELPRAIILDIEARKMYWSDWGSSPKIEQANMDGTARTTLVSSGLAWVNSLALDYKNKLLYWCDAQLDKIERVDLQGNNRVLILNLTSATYHHPFGLALYEDALFWSDWSTRSIHKYNMTSSVSEVLIRGMRRPMEIHIYDSRTIATVSGSTSCSNLNGGCSHICLPNPTGHRCFCPEGVQLKPGDQFTCQGVNRCPQLFAPAHGDLRPCSNLAGQICHLSCDKGYLLSGASQRTCKTDGTWTGLQTQCTAVTCSALPAPSNGVRQGCTGAITETYNTVCQFSCFPGFYGVGPSTRRCLENGTWSGQDFSCQAIFCRSLTTPPKAILMTPSCTDVYGSSCSYSCQTGYTSSSGNVTRTCLSSGQWSGNDINCTEFQDSQPPSFGVSCPANPLLAYAEREKFTALVNWTEPVATDNSGVAPTVTSNYQSPQRFSQGTHVITYTAVDKSGHKATFTFTVKVIVINCTSLMIVPSGPLRMSSCGNHYGATCKFSCVTGHRLNGSSSVTCVARGNKPPGFWDNPVPVCQAIRCPSLPVPPHGHKIGCSDPHSEHYGTTCSFSCNVGYILTGSSRRQCLENETWSGLAASCRVINCTALVPSPNVIVSPSSCLSRSTYGQACRFSCQKTGYVLEGTNIRVCSNGGQWTGSNDTKCRDNTPPSFNSTCPRNMIFYVPKCSSNVLVSWNEPIATDNSGHVTVRYPAVRPPANLTTGLYSVHYLLRDDEGNTANCSFIVFVARKTCPALQRPINGAITSLSCGWSFGSQASFSCDPGYRQVGSRVRSCEESGRWSGNATTCNIVKCPPIKDPAHGMVYPTQCKIPLGVNYKTYCFFMCDTSNSYRLEGPLSVSCLENGSWSADVSQVICRDIQPPKIPCPANMDVPTDTGESYANVTWKVPNPTDNSDDPLNITGLLPPQQLKVGRTHIRYEVKDSAGLRSSCVFSIHVKDVEPPKIASCPGDIEIISPAKWYKLMLPAVTVTDNVGVHLFTTNAVNGSRVTWGEYNITYTAKDKAGNAAYCRFLITVADPPCTEFKAPKNGAKACETWLAGMICTVHCNEGYGFAEHQPPTYQCSPTTGKWLNFDVPGGVKNLVVHDCSKTHIPKGILLNGNYHYLTGKCGTEEVNKQIAGNFIELLMRTSLGMAGACHGHPDCTIGNVKVQCGEKTEARKRRDADEENQSIKIPLTVSFTIKVLLPNNTNESDFNRTSLQISNDIMSALNKEDMTLNVSATVLVKDTSRPVEVHVMRLICDQGQVENGGTCVNCPVGYFFNGTRCQPCAVDRYQDKEGQTSCIPCPSGTSTSGQQGSKQRQNCQDLPSKPSQGMSKTTLVLIIVVSVLSVLLMAVVIWCAWQRCRCRTTTAASQNRLVGVSNPAYVSTEILEMNINGLSYQI